MSHSLMAYSLRGRALFNCGLLLLQPVLLFLPTILLPFPAVMLFNPSLLGLFGPTACSFLNDSVWPLGFLLHHLRAPVSHLFLLGHPWPIYFPWVSLALFLTLHSYGLFTNSFGLPWPNYLIPHPWGSWACHQSLIFFVCITLGLLWPILTFLHHILPIGLSFLSSASFRPICFFKAHLFILWACNPLFLPFWLNGFFYPFTNSFLPMLLGFFFLLDFPK